MVWRSGHPDELDAAGWAQLREAGIITVIDLRNAAERASANETIDGIHVVWLPLEDVDDPEYLGRWNRNWATPEFYRWGREQWPVLWATVMTAIAKSRGGVLVHCAGGRDRTGMVVATLLETAGVERGAILDDYVRGIRESGHDDIDSHVDEYRDALDRLLNGLVPEPELTRAAARLLEVDGASLQGDVT